MLFHANRNQRRAGAAIPTPGKLNFKSKRVRQRRALYINKKFKTTENNIL